MVYWRRSLVGLLGWGGYREGEGVVVSEGCREG